MQPYLITTSDETVLIVSSIILYISSCKVIVGYFTMLVSVPFLVSVVVSVQLKGLKHLFFYLNTFILKPDFNILQICAHCCWCMCHLNSYKKLQNRNFGLVWGLFRNRKLFFNYELLSFLCILVIIKTNQYQDFYVSIL